MDAVAAVTVVWWISFVLMFLAMIGMGWFFFDAARALVQLSTDDDEYNEAEEAEGQDVPGEGSARPAQGGVEGLSGGPPLRPR